LDNTEWEVDDAIFIVFMMSMALAVFTWRRMRDLHREVTARRAAEDAAQRLARHDPLTGLPNRRYFNEKLEEAVANIEHEDRRAAVLMLDLDGFKAINDVHGHLIGDKALIEFSERIAKAAKGVLVARVGGDEFAIVLPKIATFDEPAALARRIIAAVGEPFVIAGTGTTLGVGIGISIAPNDGVTSDDLMRRADLALYRAKSEGRSSTRFFEPAMDAHVERRSAIERELRGGGRRQSDRGVLPAAGRAGRQPHHRLRSAGALEQPGARRGAARHFHRHRRGKRPDPPARRSAVAHGVPRGQDMARAIHARFQRLASAAARRDARPARARHPR
jgi:diguanylate cyclase (GGDEF)-like protein